MDCGDVSGHVYVQGVCISLLVVGATTLGALSGWWSCFDVAFCFLFCARGFLHLAVVPLLHSFRSYFSDTSRLMYQLVALER